METSKHRFIRRLIGSVIANVVIFGGLLFLPAGTFESWRAWAFLGVVFVGTVATMLGVFARSQELLDERLKPPVQQGQPLADKILVVLFIATFLGLIPCIPLDVFHLHLMSKAPTMVSSLGLLAARILFEERFLRRELKGYEAYTGRVRSRLIPLLW